jgi:hypothetical protein
VEPGAGGTPLGAVSREVDGTDPQPGDVVGSSLCDLVICGTVLGMPGRTAPGDVILALRSLGVMGLWVAGLLLPGPPGSSSPPVDEGHMEDSIDYTCLLVTNAERLLRRRPQPVRISCIQFGLV